MSLHHGPECAEDPCDFCQNRAEERAEGWGHDDDWRLGQTQYERQLDRMGQP